MGKIFGFKMRATITKLTAAVTNINIRGILISH
jgi:hypothetical protein